MFRNSFEPIFGSFDLMLAPFVPTLKGKEVNPTTLRDLNPDCNDISRVIPQILGNNAAEFVILAKAMYGLGYGTINWNLGCPHPVVAKKKRGAGLLSHPDWIKQILDSAIPKLPCPLSVKVRLGYERNDDLDTLIPIFNDYPLSEVIIHARTGIQLYSGTADVDRFDECAHECRHPVVYNGDIADVSGFNRLKKRLPDVHRWMIGRGMVCDPFLLADLRSGTNEPRDIDTLRHFHETLYLTYGNRLCGPTQILGKMKELWSYLAAPIASGSLWLKKIQKVQTLAEYADIVDRIFRQLESQTSSGTAVSQSFSRIAP